MLKILVGLDIQQCIVVDRGSVPQPDQPAGPFARRIQRQRTGFELVHGRARHHHSAIGNRLSPTFLRATGPREQARHRHRTVPIQRTSALLHYTGYRQITNHGQAAPGQ